MTSKKRYFESVFWGLFLTFAFAGAAYGDLILFSGPDILIGGGILALIATIPVCLILMLISRRLAPKALLARVFIYLWLACSVFIAFLGSGGGDSRATTSAEATNVIYHLRDLKTGALAYYSALAGSGNALPAPCVNHIDRIAPYTERFDSWLTKECAFYVASDETGWVGYDTSAQNRAFKAKLETRAPIAGLYGSARFDTPPLSSDQKSLYREKDRIVWLPIDFAAIERNDGSPASNDSR